MSTDFNNCKELERPIIFIGNPRSGTTIISNIVMRHKDLGFPSNWHNVFPKSTFINLLRYLFQNRLWKVYSKHKYAFRASENYNVWSYNLEQQYNFGRDFLINKKATKETKIKARKYFKKVIKYQGKKRLAFKLTGPAKIEYLLSIFPDAQFVRIHRNPVATVSSLLKSNFWDARGAKKLWWTGVYSDEEKALANKFKDNPVALTAIQIKKVSTITDLEIQKMNASVFDVHYDEFIQHPEKTISEILYHLNLPLDNYCLDFFKKNKIYNKTKTDEDYFSQTDLKTIYEIYSEY